MKAPAALNARFTRHPQLGCWLLAVLAAGLGLSWQLTLVNNLYGGNWSALFYHGVDGGGVPNDPAFAGTYLFPNDFGFDGQYYRILAHDPFLTRGYSKYLERPVMRYRRILVPFLAYALAFGRQRYIDAGFIATILIFLGLGVYWLAHYALLFHRSALWGLAFLLAPATLAGIERGAVDTALTALTVGFALYIHEGSRYRLFLVLVMAGLCRETGLCLALACVGASLFKGDWTSMAWSAASMLPALAWYGFVQAHSPTDPSSDLMRAPFTDLVQSLLHHDVSFIKSGASIVQFAYYTAIFGTLMAFSAAIWLAFRDWSRPECLAALAFTMIGMLLQPAGLWVEPYYFGRVLAPLLILLSLEFFRTGDWKKTLPLCLVTPSILVVSLASAIRVVKHLRA